VRHGSSIDVSLSFLFVLDPSKEKLKLEQPNRHEVFNVMPLMMDDDMEMDDLFGDGGGLALPSQPPTKELYQRVDEMRGGGACQSVYNLSPI